MTNRTSQERNPEVTWRHSLTGQNQRVLRVGWVNAIWLLLALGFFMATRLGYELTSNRAMGLLLGVAVATPIAWFYGHIVAILETRSGELTIMFPMRETVIQASALVAVSLTALPLWGLVLMFVREPSGRAHVGLVPVVGGRYPTPKLWAAMASERLREGGFTVVVR